MERGQLEYFIAIIDHGGFTAAAEALSLSQPSLSNAIKALERELGVQLFHRLARGVRVTSAGEVFAESARRILREFERARIGVQAVEDVVIGNLELITLPGLLLEPLADIIGQFRERHRGVMVRVQHAEQLGEVYRAVASGVVELGLADVAGSDEHRLVSHLASQQELVAIVPPSDPLARCPVVSLERLMDLEVITGPPGTLARDLLDIEARRMRRVFRPAVEVGLRGSALYFVLAGAGVAVLPRPFANLCGGGRVVAVPIEPRQFRSAYLIHRASPLSPAASALLKIALFAADTSGTCAIP